MNMEAFKKAMLIGFAGTFMMTVFSYFAHSMHLPRTDFHGMITSFFHTEATATWIVYFALGGVFAYIYRTFFHDKLPDHSWKRGLYYALFLWMFMGVVVMPYMGMSFFAGSMMTAVGLYLGVGMYGATVGYLYE